MVFNTEFKLKTTGAGDLQDITGPAVQAVKASGIADGLIHLFVPGSTAGITSIEFEPGLQHDLPELLEQLVPSGRSYHHDRTWGDGNGFSHLRAALIGPSYSAPVADGRLRLGTWQQIVFLEFDNRPRQRVVLVTVLGD